MHRGCKSSVDVFQNEDGAPVVPLCRVPFNSTRKDLQPAIDLYNDGQRQQTMRYIHLAQAACPWQSADHFHLRLILAILQLESNQAHNACHLLQLALSWRNQREKETVLLNALPAITAVEWIAMANIALHVDDFHTAEVYATRAIADTSHRPLTGVSNPLHDSRADAMTVLAATRLRQQRYREAELLLKLSQDAHTKAGDSEQVLIDLSLSIDIELQNGSVVAAGHLIVQAEHLLLSECAQEKHCRLDLLRKIVEQRRGVIRRSYRNRRASWN
ncbi:MAG: hypothetical protein GY758_27460 [Fuerstiella sp.]|nr:hypothetical protein [Fuerstiella sp.]MCP4505358.1 hypothetical protein [Fuerstiella sp.]MDG2131112.1 hypothetical protein [Fuerstiella sp.]